jgi:NAD(P)-dependent dehydrogenase (short-subunit alcohol dehydrogenase family)
MSARTHALVLGGTGAIGGAVLRALSRAGLPATFTYCRREERARAIASEHGQTAIRVDLARDDETRALFERLDRDAIVPDVLVHCAAAFRPTPLGATTGDDLAAACAVTGRAALVATQEMARRLEAASRPGHVVLVGALDRGQSLPLPVTFAAAQGMLGAMTMALAKELGPAKILVNLVAGGPTGKGISEGLDAALLRDFEKLSALRRLGTPDEIAAAVLFLALENEYMTGKTFAANGGI